MSGICSGVGWWSCYYNGVEFWFERVVAFAAIDDPLDDDRSQLVGIDQTNLNTRLNRIDKDSNWFRGYVHESDFSEIGKKLNSESEERMKNLNIARSERQDDAH